MSIALQVQLDFSKFPLLKQKDPGFDSESLINIPFYDGNDITIDNVADEKACQKLVFVLI
jgi:hypothetical protein